MHRNELSFQESAILQAHFIIGALEIEKGDSVMVLFVSILEMDRFGGVVLPPDIAVQY